MTWLKLKDAPLDTLGYVYSPDRHMAGRTDVVGLVYEYQNGERGVSAANTHGFKFTHWHPLLPAPESE